ncbi:hypothetical protein ACRAWG_17615 [Methylobacterium sp. P31]
MDVFAQAESALDARETVETPCRTEAKALWLALEADRRARDERTARLRAMRLIAGDDEAA